MVVIQIVSLTRNQIIAGVVIAIAALAVGLTVGYYVWTIRTKGKIISVGVEVYADEAQTTKLTEIDWGEMYPTQSKYVICWIKNTKTKNVTLDISTDNYQPSIVSQYLTTTWNTTSEAVLQPNEVISAIIQLSVAATIENITNFSYDITIKATATDV